MLRMDFVEVKDVSAQTGMKNVFLLILKSGGAKWTHCPLSGILKWRLVLIATFSCFKLIEVQTFQTPDC